MGVNIKYLYLTLELFYIYCSKTTLCDHRLVVTTSRCGRENVGLIPAEHDTLLLYFIINQICELKNKCKKYSSALQFLSPYKNENKCIFFGQAYCVSTCFYGAVSSASD